MGQTGGSQAGEKLPLFIRKHALILPQEADTGLWETTYINWGEEVNNIKKSLMPLLHYAAPSRFSSKRTLGCSNLRGSSLTSGDLHCSFAPAHLYQMISSSTSNLLTLIPHSQSTSTPPPLLFLSLLPFLWHFSFLLSFASSSPSLFSVSVSPQVCVGEFWDGWADRGARTAIPLKCVCTCVFNVTSIQIKKD